MGIRENLLRLIRWQHTALILILLATVSLHLSTINQPKDLILDEQHYVSDARSIIREHTTERPEHPPLGKLFIIAGIKIFGDNPFGWRIFAVLSGTAGIALFYFICHELGMSQHSQLLATFLLAFENMSFVQSSVAMLDVFMVTFSMASFLLYLKGKYTLSALALALGALAKLPAAFAIIAIGLHYWLVTKRTKAVPFLTRMLVAPISFFSLMPVLDFFITRRFESPVERIKTMANLMSSLTFATTKHEAVSRPWEWVLLPRVMPYWYEPRYTAAISFNLWALIIPVAIYLALRSLMGHNASIFGFSWFTATYLSWIPVSLFTDRVSFVFYFYPTVGAICIGVALGLSQLYTRWGTLRKGKLSWAARFTVWGYLVLHLVVFAILTPVFT